MPPTTITTITIPALTQTVSEVTPYFAFTPWIIVFVFALIFSFSCMAIAKAKGYNPAAWWFIGFVLGLIGLFILACFPSKNPGRV